MKKSLRNCVYELVVNVLMWFFVGFGFRLLQRKGYFGLFWARGLGEKGFGWFVILELEEAGFVDWHFVEGGGLAVVLGGGSLVIGV